MKVNKPLEELLDSLKSIEGFPIGKDEDILALSDPRDIPTILCLSIIPNPTSLFNSLPKLSNKHLI